MRRDGTDEANDLFDASELINKSRSKIARTADTAGKFYKPLGVLWKKLGALEDELFKIAETMDSEGI